MQEEKQYGSINNEPKHYIKQKYEYAIENPDINQYSFLEMVQLLSMDYFDTLNNEPEETSYLNNEDDRTINNDIFLWANEFGLNINSMKHLHIGTCKREIWFKLKNSKKFLKKDLNSIETYERNEFIKKQWIRKFKIADVVEEIKEHPIKEFLNVQFKSKEKYIIHDKISEKKYILMIKPINDSAITVKNELFINKQPLKVHLCELVATICYFQMPVKLLYVGKNNSETFKEFNCGLKNECLYIDGTEYLNINVKDVFNEAFQLQQLIKNKTIIPKADYIQESFLDANIINDLYTNKIINMRTAQDLHSNKPYTSFQCEKCLYRDLCKFVGPDMQSTEEKND